ncbi:MAG: thrombospondin type 3 repeat-containing protein [Phaeodactylibacter sp.]|nr:thrombospondin type 3 repeat-containing protein [Phaeodactylibacter sp.]
MKQTYLLATLLLLWTQLVWGQQDWTAGILTGTTVVQGDLSSSRYGDFDKMGITIGGYIQREFPSALSLRFQFIQGDFVGDDLSKPSGAKGFGFRTVFSEASLLTEWHFLQHHNIDTKWSPYIGLGMGLLFFNPSTDFRKIQQEAPIPGEQADRLAQKRSPSIVIPGNLGIKYALSDRLQLGLEANLRATFTDYIDGVSQAANPELNDWFMTTTISLSYSLGKTDRDKDGIPDEHDRCPDHAGEKVFEGCPDTDKDGIPDLNDACPNQAGYLDGCPDSDTDGVPDFIDQCPYRPGPPQQSGCPNTDTDADGVPDEEDKCPNRPGPSSRGGCPPEDLDRDGFFDEHDQCPEVAGTRAHFGCPELNPPEFRLLDNLYFNPGGTQLQQEQEQALRKIASQLVTTPEAFLLIQGVAPGSEGLSVAQDRTMHVYHYLLSWGVSKSRINFGVYLVNPEPGEAENTRRVSLFTLKK